MKAGWYRIKRIVLIDFDGTRICKTPKKPMVVADIESLRRRLRGNRFKDVHFTYKKHE